MVKVHCSGCGQEIELPSGTRSGDIIECHGMKQRVTYEYGAYALEKV